jgi:hypothetical protein
MTIGRCTVAIPGLDCSPDPGGLRIGELKLFGIQRERGVPHYPFLARDHFALHFDRLLLVGVERDAVLNGPDRANRAHVCPLRAQERMQVEALGVILYNFIANGSLTAETAIGARPTA